MQLTVRIHSVTLCSTGAIIDSASFTLKNICSTIIGQLVVASYLGTFFLILEQPRAGSNSRSQAAGSFQIDRRREWGRGFTRYFSRGQWYGRSVVDWGQFIKKESSKWKVLRTRWVRRSDSNSHYSWPTWFLFCCVWVNMPCNLVCGQHLHFRPLDLKSHTCFGKSYRLRVQNFELYISSRCFRLRSLDFCFSPTWRHRGWCRFFSVSLIFFTRRYAFHVRIYITSSRIVTVLGWCCLCQRIGVDWRLSSIELVRSFTAFACDAEFCWKSSDFSVSSVFSRAWTFM